MSLPIPLKTDKHDLESICKRFYGVKDQKYYRFIQSRQFFEFTKTIDPHSLYQYKTYYFKRIQRSFQYNGRKLSMKDKKFLCFLFSFCLCPLRNQFFFTLHDQNLFGLLSTHHQVEILACFLKKLLLDKTTGNNHVSHIASLYSLVEILKKIIDAEIFFEETTNSIIVSPNCFGGEPSYSSIEEMEKSGKYCQNVYFLNSRSKMRNKKKKKKKIQIQQEHLKKERWDSKMNRVHGDGCKCFNVRKRVWKFVKSHNRIFSPFLKNELRGLHINNEMYKSRAYDMWKILVNEISLYFGHLLDTSVFEEMDVWCAPICSMSKVQYRKTLELSIEFSKNYEKSYDRKRMKKRFTEFVFSTSHELIDYTWDQFQTVTPSRDPETIELRKYLLLSSFQYYSTPEFFTYQDFVRIQMSLPPPPPDNYREEEDEQQQDEDELIQIITEEEYDKLPFVEKEEVLRRSCGLTKEEAGFMSSLVFFEKFCREAQSSIKKRKKRVKCYYKAVYDVIGKMKDEEILLCPGSPVPPLRTARFQKLAPKQHHRKRKRKEYHDNIISSLILRETPRENRDEKTMQNFSLMSCLCGKFETLEKRFKKCSRCKKAWYCSRDCQVKDWGEHKKVCSRKK